MLSTEIGTKRWLRRLSVLVLLSLLLNGSPKYVLAEEIYDPIEPVNRGIFWFNDKFDIYLLEPLAQGYDAVVPRVAQDGIRNFFTNIRFPIFLVNDLLQGKFDQASDHTARFILNSTAGIGGLIDVAAAQGLPHHHEDFGITLATYEIGDGPFIVIPFLGSSNGRDLIGRIVDAFLTPTFYISSIEPDSTRAFAISSGLYTLESVDARARALEGVASAKDASLDFYLFSRAAYRQSRNGLIYDGFPPDEFEDEFAEEDE